jgi:hypothetical protein
MLDGAAAAFGVEPVSAGNVITGWAALYGIPALLIFARGVPLGRAFKITGLILLFGLPGAGFYALLCFAMSGYIGLVGGFTLAALMIGWVAVLAAALSGNKPESPEVYFGPRWTSPTE